MSLFVKGKKSDESVLSVEIMHFLNDLKSYIHVLIARSSRQKCLIQYYIFSSFDSDISILTTSILNNNLEKI